MLHFDHYSNPGAPVLMIVHGLFGSARNWGVIAKRLSDRFDVIVVDQRNHGQSPWFETHSYEDMAVDLAQVISAVAEGPLNVVGHSMGGKAAMWLALTAPHLVGQLCVVDIAPVSYGHSQQIYIDAMRAVDLSQVEKRSDAARQLADQGVEPALQSFFTQSIDIKTKRWRLNLDVLAKDMAEVLAFPDTELSTKLRTLFIAGERSDYILPQHRAVIKARFSEAKMIKLKDAGHWAHAEQPRIFEATLRAFFKA